MMFVLRVSLVCLLIWDLAAGVSASGLDDFSNNLASDLGPLLALFGERIAIQYFSESTSFLDYLIFAIAPLGIVTAMTSAIRVCGDSSLRAFIGRAQEGDGTIETELCTSTSRDVCELFHRGGITRVFGKPRILEIVRIGGHGEASKTEDGRYVMGLYLFRDYLRHEAKNPMAAWVPKPARTLDLTAVVAWLSPRHSGRGRSDIEHADGKKKMRTGERIRGLEPLETSLVTDGPGSAEPVRRLASDPSEAAPELIAQNPNISINIGIVKPPQWFFWFVAVLGLALQSGVIVMAAVVSWRLQWTQDGDPERRVSVPAAFIRNRYPLAYIFGTVCLSCGILACAALIGESTEERRYERRVGGPEPRTSQLLWVQPGNQVVGDETFDAFAYIEGADNKRLSEYTTSSKRKVDHLYPYTWIAVILALGGYIAQFVGLRGMNASISIAQLGVTLVMSVLRSCLRIRRLKRTDNQLAEMPDMVLGHELDWLAFQIASEEAPKATTSEGDSSVDARAEKRICGWVMTGHVDAAGQGTVKGSQQDGDGETRQQDVGQSQKVNRAETLLKYRTRLADLTGHQLLAPLKPQSVQVWDDKQVLVRVMAQNLAMALCSSANALFGSADGQGAVTLGLWANVWRWQSAQRVAPGAQQKDEFKTFDPTWSKASQPELIEVVLEPPNDASPSSWIIDSARLEGILGLWLWSLKEADTARNGHHTDKEHSITEEIPMARIILAERTEGRVDESNFEAMENELDLWLGQDVLKPQRGTLHVPWQPEAAGPSGRWWSMDGKSWWAADTKTPRVHSKRFFGWQAIQPSAGNRSPNDATGKMHALYSNSRNGLLTSCCQELYTALLVSLVSKTNCTFDGVTVAETLDQIRLEDPRISALVAAFTENGLGPRLDAILCIVPSLRKHIRPAKADLLQSSLLRALQQDNLANKKVEALLEWIYVHSKGSKEEASAVMKRQVFANALVAVCEFYRRMFNNNQTEAARHSGYRKLQRLIQKYLPGAGDDGSEIGEILGRYSIVAMQIALDHDESSLLMRMGCAGFSQVPRPADLTRVITANKKAEALYLLCIVPPRLLVTELESALPLAAAKWWDEVVRALLNLGAFVDGRSESGRTALSYYCGRRGTASMVRILLENRAHPDLPDKHKRTPLWWAARAGDRQVASALWETRKVDPDSVDDHGRSPLSLAAENGQREIVRMLCDSDSARLDLADRRGRTPFFYAAANGHAGIVKDLVTDWRVDPDLPDNDGRTPFSWAAGNGHVEVVKALGAIHTVDIDAKDNHHRAPLFWAVANGHLGVVEQLRDNVRVDPNARDIYGQSPLIQAAKAGGLDAIAALLDDVRVDIGATDEMGRTALWWALRSNELEAAKILLAHTPTTSASPQAFDPDLHDNAGRTPFWWAARNGYEQIACFLLEKGANPDIKDSSGLTPLWWAVRNGHAAIVRLLIDTGRVEPDARGSMGGTAFMWATRRGDLAVAKMLFETGKINLLARDDDGRSVLSWASGRRPSHVLEALGLVTKQGWADETGFERRPDRGSLW